MHLFYSERLIFRPLSAQDKTLYCTLYTDERIMRYMGGAFSQQKAEKSLTSLLNKKKRAKKDFILWTLINSQTNQAIGFVMLYNILYKQQLKHYEVGVILVREANGKLFAEEAIGAAVDYGFTQLNLQQINARYDKKNLASKRIVKKIGFVIDALNQPENIAQQLESIYKNRWHQQFIVKLVPKI